MPRRARIRVADIAMHVVQRGNNRQQCFIGAQDYQYYLQQLESASRSFDCSIHAYVLMPNHVHLLLTPACEDGVSQLMKNLGQRVVQRFNRTRDRTGSLWEGRFRSSLVDSGRYLFNCYRYIELNPVRAGLAARPGDYPWSSYQTNAEGRASRTIRPHPEYLQLGEQPASRFEAYRELFGTPLEPGEIEMIRGRTNGGFPIGGEAFRMKLADRLGRIVDPQRRQPTPPPASGTPP